ncbi:anti-sigma factor [Antrihabitans sp. YC3-6]|uniref:Regulator of SigK n=1 Tax=Antrihabitans stalagmiti TaxID=2799499 RepID=A0A934U1T3_9NOCA|nr:anti-sigma factor [Antrihabitans stalagmiti]MBJ8338535.1 anti-sigma factor [Antrihabitans stalagmiti]
MMDDRFIDLAHAYALDSLDTEEHAAVAELLSGPASDLRSEFEATVRQTRETLASISSTTATAPPAELRSRLLDLVAADAVTSAPPQPPRPSEPSQPSESTPQTDSDTNVVAMPLARHRRTDTSRWRTIAVAAAAAVALLVGGAVAGYTLRGSDQTPSTTEDVLAASDAYSASVALTVGGTATVVYSKENNAAVVLLDDLQKPAPNAAYQMWLVEGTNAKSAGVIAPEAVGTRTQVVRDIGTATTLAFTIEPSGGSDQPTSTPFAALPLA